VILNDSNQWDYIDSVECEDGRSVDFEDIDEMPIASRYLPSEEVSWRCYRLPGCLRGRCTICGTELMQMPFDGTFGCVNCS